MHGYGHAGVSAVTMDDIGSGNIVTGNILERCGSVAHGAVQINMGKDNRVLGNIMYRCHGSVSVNVLDEAAWQAALAERLTDLPYGGGDFTNDPIFHERYPEMINLYKDGSINTIADNLILDSRLTDEYEDWDWDRQIVSNNRRYYDLASGFCLDEAMAEMGMEAIPFDSIGPDASKNRWMRGYDPLTMPLPAKMDDSEILATRCNASETNRPPIINADVRVYSSSGVLHVKSTSPIKRVIIYDANGHIIATQSLDSTETVIHGLQVGNIYIITVYSGMYGATKLIKL
jgi:hypothetical protein